MTEPTPKSTKQELHEACMAYAETIRGLEYSNRHLRNQVSARDTTIEFQKKTIKELDDKNILLNREVSRYRQTFIPGLFLRGAPYGEKS